MLLAGRSSIISLIVRLHFIQNLNSIEDA